MRFVFKTILFFLFLVWGFSSDRWIVKFDDMLFFEKDFYVFFPKNEWQKVSEGDRQKKILFDFLKQKIAVYRAKELGLQYSVGVVDKLRARLNMLLVNEYYMKYFLGSVVPHSALLFCKQNLKSDVFVKHILLRVVNDSLSSEKQQLADAQQLKDSILLGLPFELAATKYSIDPAAKQNGGVLGWISIGQTVPVFQDAVFNLCVGCLDVVKTKFGLHIIQVDSLRSSQYFNLGVDEYEDFAFRFSTAYIMEPLKVLAAQHDSMLISLNGVNFNENALLELLDLIKDAKKSSSGSRKDVNVSKILQKYQKVVLEYNKSFLSGAWFAYKINTSLHKNVFYSTVEEMRQDFITIILRDIAFRAALELKLNSKGLFISQYNSIEDSVLEKAYLNYLIASVPVPSKVEIENYFNSTNASQKSSLSVSYNSIKTVLLQQKQKQIKQGFFDSIEKAGDKLIINDGWFYE